LKIDLYNTHTFGEEVYVCLVHYTSASKKPQRFLEPTKCTLKDGLLKNIETNKTLAIKTTDNYYLSCFDNESECFESFYNDLIIAQKQFDSFSIKLQNQITRIKANLELVVKNYPELCI